MKNKLILLLAISALLPLALQAQGTLVIDQQSGPDGTYGELPFGLVTGADQSFTPSLSGLGFISLYFFDASPQNTASCTLYVNVRQDSISGTILGSSDPITLPATGGGVLTFRFSTPLTVTPGTTYYFEPKIQTGAVTFETTGSRLFNYAGGVAYSGGTPVTGADLWFREGIAVPEPSASFLVLAGAAFLACVRFARRARWPCFN